MTKKQIALGVLVGMVAGATLIVSMQIFSSKVMLTVCLTLIVVAGFALGQNRLAKLSLNAEYCGLNLLPDEIWIVDTRRQKIVFSNTAAIARVTRGGTTRSSIKLHHMLPPDHQGRLSSMQLQTLEDITFDGRILRPKVVELKDTSLVMVTFRDVTRELVEEKTKSDFISTVSHELRSPLTSIKGSMGLLLSNAAGELPKPARGLLEIAHRNAERLVLILNDILDLQKMVEGGMEFETRDVDAAALIHEAVAASALFLQRFDLDIVVEGCDAPVPIESDPNRLLQVLGNLLTNAAKFSKPHGTIHIRLSKSENEVTIEVADQGVGIPYAEQSKIFERFADMSNSDRQKKGGSGLGLSICKAIIDNLSGKIGFESAEAVGTTFYISLPCSAVEKPPLHIIENMRGVG